VADLAPLPGVFEQVRLVAGLRYRILKNGLRRKNNVWDLIAMIWVGVVAASVVVGVGFAFAAGSYAFLQKGHSSWLAFLYWGLFLWWQVFPIFLAGFGSNFEFATLLRFPLSMRAFYLLGLGYGLSDFAAISSICWLFCMLAGTAFAQIEIVPAMILVSTLFVLINLTLERLIGSWVEMLLSKRRAREIFFGIFVLCMVSLNFLNPAIQRWGHASRSSLFHWITYLAWLPGSLTGSAVAAAVHSDAERYLAASAGLLAWTAVLSLLLWRRFAEQYAGEQLSESLAPTSSRKKTRTAVSTGSDRPWLLSPQVAAVVSKEFRYLTRNGFAAISLVLPPVMVIFFTYQFGPGSPLKEHAVRPALFFPGMMAYLIIILLTPAYNSFAYEGRGIQTYFMAPVRFRDVLLGKNLFLVGLVAFELAISLTLLVWRIGWPGGSLFVATVMAGAFAVLGQLAIANWSALSFPKKMEIGKMKGQRNSGVAVWTGFGVQLVLAAICSMVLLLGRWMGDSWLPSVAFTALAAAALGGYLASLNAMDNLAERKKELLIETLTH